MKSAVAVITYRREHALRETLSGLARHCGHYPVAVFEDAGMRDSTSKFMSEGRDPKPRPDLMATEMVITEKAVQSILTEEEKLLGVKPNIPRFFLGDRNLGVAGNSNRCLRWFMEETDADHLCLLNDDLHVLGDFVRFYQQGHADLGVDHFCFCPSGGVYDHESYKWVTVRHRGYTIRLMPRITGIMMSFTRSLLDRVGYFDLRFPTFGHEHVDFTYRCQFAGGIRLEGQDHGCLDLEPQQPLLRHQDVQTSVTGADRARCDAESIVAMREASQRYRWEHYHKPFRLMAPKWAASHSGIPGIPFDHLIGHALVTALV